MNNLAFVGGGTGGHVFPIKSLILDIQKDKKFSNKIGNIYWVGETNSLEYEQSKHIYNINFISIISGKFRREKSLISILYNIIDLFKIFLGVFLSIYYILIKKIDIIFCKGGYVALPFVVAGWILRKNIIVHESDTVPGITNKISSKFSTITFTGFPNVLEGGIHAGQIISDNIFEYEEDILNIDFLNLKKTNVLVSGGSQGARSIYNTLLELLEEDKIPESFNFFIVLGTKNLDFQKKFEYFNNVKTYDFLDQKEIGFLYKNCDISITRGGATSLAEQKAFGLHLIIVPLPYTGGNHQYYNGLYYFNKYADNIIDQSSDMKEHILLVLKDYIGYKKNIQYNFEETGNKKILEHLYKII